MRIAVIGRGLIGGSLMKAAARAGHDAIGIGHADDFAVGDRDLVFVATPPRAVAPVVARLAPRLRPGAVVVDMAGVKRAVLNSVEPLARGAAWTFVGGHPMAGRPVGGFANSRADLFDGASMILVPFPSTPRATLDALAGFFRELGFARVVETDPDHHDEMIAFTSQLCHLASSAYLREPLAAGHVGFSAGSFRDLSRVGAPDPDLWTDLFLLNRDALLPVLERYVERLSRFREAIAAGDADALRAALEEGVRAKSALPAATGKP